MKVFLLRLFCASFIIFSAFISQAHAINTEIEYYKQVVSDIDFSYSDNIRINTYLSEDSSMFLWVSGTYSRHNLDGYIFGHTSIIGSGLGMRKQLSKNISLYFGAGIYYPVDTHTDEVLHLKDEFMSYGELFQYYLEGYSIDYILSNIYEIEVKGNFGCMVGSKYHFSVNGISGYLHVGYQFLTLPTQLKIIIPDDDSDIIWNQDMNQNLSGPYLGFGITW